jgi:LysR family transcriptional regulator (chromosome initiation inhibitor)
MMAFQFDQLRTLTALVDEGTFDAAAARLHVTASAVSQRIKSMEEMAGRVLVLRTNPVATTPAGNIVLRLARQTQLLERDALALLATESKDGPSVVVPIAVNADSLATWFLDALADVPPALGAVFDIRREDQEHTTQLLRAGEVMAAITSTAEAVQGCSSERLGAMRYRAVCSRSFAVHWLGGEPLPKRLGEAPMVNFDRKDDLRHRFFRELTGRAPQAPRHYVPTSADFARAIVLGLGWGLLPEQQCSAEIRDGTLVDLAPASPVDVQLYWQRWNLSSPLLDRVSDAVRAAAAGELYS